MMGTPSSSARWFVLTAVLALTTACGSGDAGGASSDQLTCAGGTVQGRQQPDADRDGAATPVAAVATSLLEGEHAESSAEDAEEQTVTVFARTDDGVTAQFKTWNPSGRGWFVVESVRCAD